MKNVIKIIFFLAVAYLAAPVWAADAVYKCIGETGEASFSARPCNEVSEDVAKYAVHNARLEQVKLEIVEVRREMMDLKREHRYQLTQVPVDEAPAMIEKFDERIAAFEREIVRLKRLQTRLVGDSFEELLQADAKAH